MNTDMEDFLTKLPKAELHIHLEGTLDCEIWWKLSQRNNVHFPYASIEDAKKAFEFKDLMSFLTLSDTAAQSICTEEDFYDIVWNYVQQSLPSNTRHMELTWGPTNFFYRGITMEMQMKGMIRAKKDALEKYGISVEFILCIIRHHPIEQAFDLLEKAEPFKQDLIGIGLAGPEVGFPPSLFEGVYKLAKEKGFKLTAHAGEEGDPSYITEAIDMQKCDRIDHGCTALKDESVIQKIFDKKIHLTKCPCSNVRQCVFPSYQEVIDSMRAFYDKGISISVNSDDPPYFEGYLMDNYFALNNVEKNKFTKDDWIKQARYSFEGSFLSDDLKKKYLREIDEYVASNGL